VETSIAGGMLLKDSTEKYSSLANTHVDSHRLCSVHLSLILYAEQQNKTIRVLNPS
jgi:hypothetical protein